MTPPEISKLTKLKPALGRIVLEPLPDEERTASGLFLVAEARERPIHVAKVVEVCEQRGPMSDPDDEDFVPFGTLYKVGQIVVIGKFSGVDIKLGRTGLGQGQKHYLIINESEVLATLEEEDGAAGSASSGSGTP